LAGISSALYRRRREKFSFHVIALFNSIPSPLSPGAQPFAAPTHAMLTGTSHLLVRYITDPSDMELNNRFRHS